MLIAKIGVMLERAIDKHLPEDVVEYDASMYPLPSDTGWAPSVFLYVMIQPVGEADGAHMGQFTSPYQLAQELVDTYVEQFAAETEERRARVRQQRAAGETEHLGVAVDDLTV